MKLIYKDSKVTILQNSEEDIEVVSSPEEINFEKEFSFSSEDTKDLISLKNKLLRIERQMIEFQKWISEIRRSMK